MTTECEYCKEFRRAHKGLAINRIHKMFKCTVREALGCYSIAHLSRTTGVARDIIARLRDKLGIKT